ncbi:uncharacterized protein LOC144048545 isoform X2 [Vanacampus margaritifer]
MLKELVRERLIAAADEIYVLFETTMASYKEQLCRAREESERHRRQLEAVCKTQVIIRVEDVEQVIGRQEELPDVKWGTSSLEQEYPQPTRVKEEEEESGVTRLPLNGVSGESKVDEDEPPKWSNLHHSSPSGDHCGSPPPDNLLALLSDGDDMEEPLGSGANCEDVQQLIGSQEELPPQPLWGMSSLELEHLQPSHFEEEEEQEADIKFPLTCVSVKSEDDENDPPEWSQRHRNSPREDHCEGSAQDNLLAPMSDSDDTEEPFRSDADCDGDDKQSKCSQKGTPKKKPLRKRSKLPTHKEHFSCSVCGKNFTCKSHWMRHMKTHSGEKSFCCSVCGKTFSRKEHMQLHMRTHTGEKPFRCSVCGATFSVKQSMKKHMRRHTGEKPFSCSFCGTTFSRKESLDKHMRVHTGEKPFSCSVCGGSFAQRSNMTRHMQIHKKVE